MMLQPVPRLLKLNFLTRLQKCFPLPCRFLPRKLKTRLETQISFSGDYLVSTMDQLIENKENIEQSVNTCCVEKVNINPKAISDKNLVKFNFIYQRKEWFLSEQQYLNAIEHIINHGSRRSNRTGIDTLSVFGMQMRYNIREAFPLFTTKRVFWRGILEEMLWFIQGCTNSNELKNKDVHIWDANGSRNFLDNLGFTEREEGDLGPVYGFQWRHFGAEYADFNTDYKNMGVDQLRNVIDLIKKNPDDRRIIMSAWNPVDLPKMALPPCHVMCQFYVNNGELSCQMYQRSGDMGLGVPFNVASYSLLVYMIAHITGLKPGDFIHTLGDAHVYVNHVKPLKIQLQRALRPLPTLEIKRKVTDIDDFKVDDFEILNYRPHKKIQMDMAV